MIGGFAKFDGLADRGKIIMQRDFGWSEPAQNRGDMSAPLTVKLVQCIS